MTRDAGGRIIAASYPGSKEVRLTPDRKQLVSRPLAAPASAASRGIVERAINTVNGPYKGGFAPGFPGAMAIQVTGPAVAASGSLLSSAAVAGGMALPAAVAAALGLLGAGAAGFAANEAIDFATGQSTLLGGGSRSNGYMNDKVVGSGHNYLILQDEQTGRMKLVKKLPQRRRVRYVYARRSKRC